MPVRLFPRIVRSARRVSLTGHTSTRFSSTSKLEELVPSEPTWSVESLLPSKASQNDVPAVTSEKLRHLLRLSALPPPKDSAEESKMLQTLSSQLHFVQDIQRVNTSSVEPLRSIRDETSSAEQTEEINLKTLRQALDDEVHLGKYHKRIRRRKELPVDTNGAEDWDSMAHADQKVGQYFVVDSQKD